MPAPEPLNHLGLIRNGLQPRASTPKKVIVVGAGMAGLTATYELQRAGHDPLILEARQRVGGRIYALREPFTEGLYAEVGGMRIPRSHALTLAYIERFGLRLAPFTMDNPQAYYYIGGRRMRILAADADPSPLGFEVADHERGQTARQLWKRALRPVLDKLRTDGDAAWSNIVAQYDEFAGGAFALFDPSQQTLLHQQIIAPEGRIQFAGEHASLAHAWIQGAIESGLRTAHAIHTLR